MIIITRILQSRLSLLPDIPIHLHSYHAHAQSLSHLLTLAPNPVPTH